MRISNPTLFNGQTLATKQQISAWLSGGVDASFGTLNIPASGITYGQSNVSTQIANIYAKLGLDNDGEDFNVIQSITNIETNLATVSSNLDKLEGTVGTLSNTLVSVSSSLEDADEYISGIVDTKADQATLVSVSSSLEDADEYISGIVDTKADQTVLTAVSSELKAADDYISGVVDTKADQTVLTAVSSELKAADDYISGVVDELSSWQTRFVDKTAVVSGTGLAQVITGAVVDGVQTFTVDVPSAVAFYNHDIKLSGVTATEGYASSYALMVDGVAKGDPINIPKDQYLSGVTYIPSSNTLRFEWKLANGVITPTDVQITDLIDTISGGTGISTTGNTVSVKIKDNDKYITADASGLQTKGIDEAITAAVSDKATISTVNAIDARLSGAESTLTGKADISTVNVIDTRLQAAEDTLSGVESVKTAIEEAVSDKALQTDLWEVSGKVEEHTTSIDGINTLIGTGTINVQGTSDIISAINQTYDVASAAKTSAEEAGAAAAVAKDAADAAQGAADDAQSSADAAQQSADDAQASADSAQQSADAAAASINELSGTVLEHAITFEEVSLSGLADDSSVTVEGRIMQVFDANGWVYPEVKFTTNGEKVSSTVTITEWNTISDKTALSGLSGLVSKKVAAIATIPAE